MHRHSPKRSTKRIPTTIYQRGVDSEGNPFCIPYQIGDLLGKGGFASCHSAKVGSQNKDLAVKIFEKQGKRNRNLQKINNEIEIMSKLKHEGIVRLYHKFQDNIFIYAIMELCTKRSLNLVIQRRFVLQQPQVRYIVSQLVPVLKYLKQKEIIHRDIKMGNIFLDQNYHIKIGDFGLSTYNSNAAMKRTVCGTPNYIAPEIINKLDYSFQVDIWSTGILIYVVLFGRPPFEADSIQQTYKNINKCQLKFQGIFPQIKVSNYAKMLLKSMLQKDISKRITVQGILKHPFMTTFNIPRSLQQNFSTRSPSEEYIKKFTSCGKRHSQISSSTISLDHRQSPSIQHCVSKRSKNAKPMLFNKQLIVKIQQHPKLNSTLSHYQQWNSQKHLKRAYVFQQSEFQQYFVGMCKKFRLCKVNTIQTRRVTKQKQQFQNLKRLWRKLLFKKQQINKINQSIKQEKQQRSTNDYGNQINFRLIYWKTYSQKQNYVIYAGNNKIMGMIFKQYNASIIYCFSQNKTYYINRQSGLIEYNEINNQHGGGEKCPKYIKNKFKIFLQHKKDIIKMFQSDQLNHNSSKGSQERFRMPIFVISIIEHNETIIFNLNQKDIYCIFPNIRRQAFISFQNQKVYINLKNKQEHIIDMDNPQLYFLPLLKCLRLAYQIVIIMLQNQGKCKKHDSTSKVILSKQQTTVRSKEHRKPFNVSESVQHNS